TCRERGRCYSTAGMGTLTTRLGVLAAVVAASFAFALVVACGDQTFTAQSTDDGGAPDATTSDDGATTGDGPTTITPEGSAYDAPAFAAPPGADSGVPLPDGGCGEQPITPQGSFVSKTTSNPGGAGHDCTPQSPCPTIQDGIAWAKLNARQFVYVEQ